MSDKQIHRNANIPIEITDRSIFDEYSNIKERFASEMKRIDEEMAKLSTNLVHVFEQPNDEEDQKLTTSRGLNWEALTTSPLVEVEGNDRVLKLQFDLSEFDPSEITVSLVNHQLQISATHELKTDTSTTFKQYQRSFHLPLEMDPDRILSELTKEGVLIVQAPLPNNTNLAIK